MNTVIAELLGVAARRMTVLAGALLVAATVFAQQPNRAEKGTRITPDQVVAEVRIDQKLNSPLPLDLPFQDDKGRDVTLRSILRPGKPAVFVMVQLNCPMMCGLMLEGVTSALRQLKFSPGKEIDVIVASIDPSEDVRDAKLEKEEYVQVYGRPGTDDGWHFLVGSEKNIRAVADAAGFRYKQDPVTKAFIHASGIMVVTPQGRMARYFPGIEYPSQYLHLSLVEASRGKIGSLADNVRLFCYQWDPVKGGYGLAIARITQASGIATALILGTYMFTMLRRDRNRRIFAAPSPADDSEPVV